MSFQRLKKPVKFPLVRFVLVCYILILSFGCAPKTSETQAEQAPPEPSQKTMEKEDETQTEEEISRPLEPEQPRKRDQQPSEIKKDIETTRKELRELQLRQLFTEALAYESLSNYSRSLELFRRVVSEGSDRRDSLAARAQIRIAQIYKNNLDNNQEAIKAYQHYVDRYEESTDRQEVLLELARLYKMDDRVDSAAETYETFVNQYKSSPYRQETLYNLSVLYLRQKQYEQAISILETLGKEFPKGELADDGLLKLAEVYGQTDQSGKQLSIYEKLLSEYPESEHREKSLYLAIKLASELDQKKAMRNWINTYRNVYPDGQYLSEIKTIISRTRSSGTQ